MQNPYESPDFPGGMAPASSNALVAWGNELVRVRWGLHIVAVGLVFLATLTAFNQFYIAFPELALQLPQAVYALLVPTLYYLSRLLLGVGYLVCLFTPRDANAAYWVAIAAGVQLLGLLPFGGMFLTSLCTLAAASLFWVYLHRLSIWQASEQLLKLKARLFWMGAVAFAMLLLSGVWIFTADEEHFVAAVQFMALVGGTCMTIAYTFFAWVTWQFGQRLR